MRDIISQILLEMIEKISEASGVKIFNCRNKGLNPVEDSWSLFMNLPGKKFSNPPTRIYKLIFLLNLYLIETCVKIVWQNS